MAAKSASKSEDLSDQLETLKSDVAALTKSISQLGVAKAEDAKEEVTAQVAAVQAKAADGLSETMNFVRDKPVNALAIAAGVGFLIGMMSGRK